MCIRGPFRLRRKVASRGAVGTLNPLSRGDLGPRKGPRPSRQVPAVAEPPPTPAKLTGPPPAPPTRRVPPELRAPLFRRLLGLAWGYKKMAARVVGLQALLLALTLSGLGLTGVGVDVLKYAIDARHPPRWPLGLHAPPWSPMGQVALIAGLILVLATIRFFLESRAAIAAGELSNRIVVDLRAAVYDKLQRLSFRFYDANQSGSIINRVTGDVQAVRMFVDQVMVQVVILALSLAFYLGYMISIHVGLTLACLATTPILWLLTIWFSRRVKPAYRRNRELYDETVRVLSENFQGVHVVKGFALQDQQTAKFRDANLAVRDQKRWIFWQVSVFTPLIGFIPQVNIVVLLMFGGYLHTVSPATMTFGTLIVFAGLLNRFSSQISGIAQISNSVQQSLIGAQRVFEVLDTPVEITSKPGAVKLDRPRGRVVFEHVDFAYARTSAAADSGGDGNGDGPPPELTLEDINLTVEPGMCVALLGATGAGKSTLLSLIPRFYDPMRGRVLVDDVDVRDIEVDSLRRAIGLVFQESFLFSNTVAANIAFGNPQATRKQIEKAAEIAAAAEFIGKFPKGYDTLLGERASNLSGGQRQRLAIARAVLLEPAVLLMDDPTAAIDPETEHEILQAMDSAMKGRTTFIVAHRLSTLRRADLIVVLDKGRIVQAGTHDELMNTTGIYRRAAALQLADDESRKLLGLTAT